MPEFPKDLESRYRCMGELARGGMGVVFKALQLRLVRLVAVKLFDPLSDGDPEISARFVEEGRLAARIRHPHVVTVIESGVTPCGRLFIVYEFLDGESIEHRLERPGPLPLEMATSLTLSILAGLDAIHAAGIVHRDIKPGNVIVLPDGQARIVDFGIARDLLSARRRTRTGEILGTPEYLAPEVIRGEASVQATDLYAVGVLLFVMLTGRHPFEWKTLGDLLRAHLESTPPDPATLSPGVPPRLGRVVLDCLAKDPLLRPGSALDLSRAIEAACADAVVAWPDRSPARAGRSRAGSPTQVSLLDRPAAGEAAAGRPDDETVTVSVRPAAVVPGSRTRKPLVVAGVALLGIVALLAWTLGGRSPVAIKSLRLVPGALEVVLGSRDGADRTERLPTPLSYPLTIPERAAMSSSPLVIRVTDVAPVLVAGMRRLPAELSDFVASRRLAGVRSGQVASNERNALARRALGPELVALWRTFADHASPILAADTDPDRLDALLDSLARLEDLAKLLKDHGRAEPFEPLAVRGGRWAVEEIEELSLPGLVPATFDPRDVERLSAKIQDEQELRSSLAVSASVVDYTRTIQWFSFPPPRLRFYDRVSRLAAGLAPSGEEVLHASLRLESTQAKGRGLVYVTLARNAHVTLYVRINDRLTLRLYCPSKVRTFFDSDHVAHYFDPAALRPGVNDLRFFAVGAGTNHSAAAVLRLGIACYAGIVP